MKNLHKSVVAFALIVVVTLTLFAGCGQDSKPSTNSSTTATSTVENTQSGGSSDPQALEPCTLKWYAIGTPQNSPEHVYEALNKITQEKINATINIETIDYGTYSDKLKMYMSSGEPFDLCFTASWANDYTAAVSKGAYLPLDELLEKYGQNITGAIPEMYWDAVRMNGQIYGILNYQIFATRCGLSMNKELVEKYGFDVSKVKKLADIEPFLKSIKENEPEYYPFLGAYIVQYFNLETGYTVDTPFVTEHPLYINRDDPDMKVMNIYETDLCMDYLTLLHNWYKKGYIRKDMASLSDVPSEQATGKYACFIAGNLKPGNEVETAARVGYQVVDVPTAPVFVTTSGTTATMTSVSRTSKNPERAVMFYDLLYSDKELYNTLCFGIEGVDYEKVDENTVRQLENSGYAPNTDWVFGNQFNAYLREGQAADVWEQTQKLNSEAQPSALMGFTYSKENLKTENAQIDALVEEYKRAFNSGTLDPATAVPEFNKRLKDAGLDAVIADMQKQIDDWRAANGK